jgi:IS30 family transposase
LTWDQGKAMAHARLTSKTGVPVYFCDPRITLRPAHYTQAELDAVAHKLNGRPRQALGWKTPSQALDEVLR